MLSRDDFERELIATADHQAKRIAELEAVAREVVALHTDVDGGADIPVHLYKMARDALAKAT